MTQHTHTNTLNWKKERNLQTHKHIRAHVAICMWTGCNRIIQRWMYIATTHCITLQHTLQRHTASRRNTHSNDTLHHAATHTPTTHCITLQHPLQRHTASRCNTHSNDTLHHAATHTPTTHYITLQHTLQRHTTSRCNTHSNDTLHHAATHCNTLQHTATHCN